jgi:hypothetical protein
LISSQVCPAPEAATRRFCTVCGLMFEKRIGEQSPCGHVNRDDSVSLPVVEAETVLVAKRFRNPYLTTLQR